MISAHIGGFLFLYNIVIIRWNKLRTELSCLNSIKAREISYNVLGYTSSVHEKFGIQLLHYICVCFYACCGD